MNNYPTANNIFRFNAFRIEDITIFWFVQYFAIKFIWLETSLLDHHGGSKYTFDRTQTNMFYYVVKYLRFQKT